MLSVLLVAEPAYAAGPLDPPSPSDAVAMTRLISCATLTTGNTSSSITQLTQDSAQLGWSGVKKYALTVAGTGDYVETVPTIPCINSGTHLGMYWIRQRLTGTSATSTAIGSVTLVVKCSTLAGTVSTQTVLASANTTNISPPNSTAGIFNTSSQITAGITTTNCPLIVSISATVYNTFAGGGTVMGTSYWLPRVWNSDSGGWTPATGIGDFDDGIELPILCVLNTTGADIFAITQNFWASLANWVPCLLIPVGWDRAALINEKWTTGNIAELSDAFNDAMPGGIACGEVGSIPLPGGAPDVSIDTCNMDVAPDFAKYAIAGIIILGIAVLAVKRIMWAVGSNG